MPQVIKLLRTRSAEDFAWGFTILNFVGIALLGLRSFEIGEWAMVCVNASTTAFWGLVLVMKAMASPRASGLNAGVSART